jgi:hypothetical protein
VADVCGVLSASLCNRVHSKVASSKINHKVKSTLQTFSLFFSSSSLRRNKTAAKLGSASPTLWKHHLH